MCRRGLHEIADPAYLKGFLVSAFLPVAQYCVRGGIRVVSKATTDASRLLSNERSFYSLHHPSFVRAAPYSHRIFRVLCLYTCLGEREDADSSRGILAFGCASIPLRDTPGANDGPGDAAAVVLPTFVGLAEDLGQPESC